jgi:transcription antitermination factor NusG
MPGESWYVVHTKLLREMAAQTQLAAQGFRRFLPRHRKTVRHSCRLRTVSAPFFPRYLFVALDLRRDRWRSVGSTFGVASLLMGDELPRPMSTGVVEGPIAATGADGHLQLSDLPGEGSLVVGQRVRIRIVPFADLVGELARLDAGGRVQVLLQLTGGAVLVGLHRDALTAADLAA